MHSVGPFVAMICIAGLIAWYRLERLKLEKGYPVESMWGKPLHPKAGDSEIAALKAELDRRNSQVERLESRVATLERILTDRGSQIAAEIDRLRS